MPTYTPLSKFTGIITAGDTVFEGIRRPQIISTFHENSLQGPEDVAILERYFSDIANLFHKRLSVFSSDGDMSGTGQDSARLRSLLEEMIKVKALILKADN